MALTQSTVEKHFQPVSRLEIDNEGNIDQSNAELQAKKTHRDRPTRALINSLIFIKQEIFNRIISGEYFGERAFHIHETPPNAQLALTIDREDIITIITTQDSRDESLPFPDRYDLLDLPNTIGDVTFLCRLNEKTNQWDIIHFEGVLYQEN